MFKANEIVYQNNDWISFVFLAVFVLLTAAKFLYNDRLFYLNGLFVSKSYFLQFFSREKSSTDFFQVLLFIVQVITFSLLLYFSNLNFQYNTDYLGFEGFLICALLVVSYFTGRFLIGLFLAFLFNLKDSHRKLVFEKTSYMNNMILWLLPFLVLSYYLTNYAILVFKFTLILALVLAIFRYVLLLINNKKLVFADLFYFILYLCALEIAPLIILFKLTI